MTSPDVLPAGRAAAERLAGRWVAGGELREAASVYRLPATTGAPLVVADVSVAEALEAADLAHAAQPVWRGTAVADRVAAVRRLGEALAAAREEIEELIVLEAGKPIRFARAEVGFALTVLESMCASIAALEDEYVDDAASGRRVRVERRPVGTALLVTPWNFPLSLGLRKVVTALLAGCPILLKPSDRTPLTSLAAGEAMLAAGFPTGVVSVLPTSDSIGVVDALLGHPGVRKLSFTGSTTVGLALQRRAADALVRTSLELGGNAPFVLGRDTAIEKALPSIMAAKFANSGQVCTALNRLYVPQDRVDEVVRVVGDALDALVVGDPAADGTDIGPLITEAAAERVTGLLDGARAAGATIREHAGEVPAAARFVRPAIVAGVATDSALAQSEVFGPVLTVIGYDDTDDAVAQANGTPYGLAAYVASDDDAEISAIVAGLDAGMIAVNAGSVSVAGSPFGGVGVSGMGRENGHWGLHEFTEIVAVVR